jgi:enoyl-CoA hydratase
MEIMRARTGPSFYEEVVLGGATYTAQEARQRGLIDVVVEEGELLTEAICAAESLAAIRPDIFSFSKQQARQPVRAAIETHTRLNAARIQELWESAEAQEAIRGFVARTLKK